MHAIACYALGYTRGYPSGGGGRTAADTVTTTESNDLRSDVTAIKNTLNNHVLSTLAAHGERLEGVETRLEGLESEVRYVKDGVQALKDHFGI